MIHVHTVDGCSCQIRHIRKTKRSAHAEWPHSIATHGEDTSNQHSQLKKIIFSVNTMTSIVHRWLFSSHRRWKHLRWETHAWIGVTIKRGYDIDSWIWHLVCEWVECGFVYYFAMFTARSNCIKFANITKSPTRIVDFVSNFSNAPKLVRDYFDEVKCKENLRLFPREILRRSRRKNPEELYAAVDSEAIRIADAIESKRNRNVPLLEVNPGPGVLTKYIHNSEAETRLLLENRPDFILQLKVCWHSAFAPSLCQWNGIFWDCHLI